VSNRAVVVKSGSIIPDYRSYGTQLQLYTNACPYRP